MASEIRVNNIKALTGLGTVTVSADGLNTSGIVTATTGFTVGVTTIHSTQATFHNTNSTGITTVAELHSNGGVGVADSIFHLEDTNTAIRFPAADTFTVETAGSERLRVNSSGKVAIGTDTAGQANADELTLYNESGAAGVSIKAGASANSNIYFADDSDNAIGRIEYRHTGDNMRFYTNDSERMQITSTGGVHFNNAEFIERVNITAGKISDNLQVSLDNGMVHYFTTTETTTSDPNIVSTAGINTSMATGDTMSVTLINTAAAAGYSPRIKIDGVYTGITTHWSGGSAPTEGSGSGSDIYAYQIVKTGDAAYRVFASFTNFA
jgi:hypothetical protein